MVEGEIVHERLAVIIPTYQRPVHLRRCLAALRAQARPGMTVVVVNDGPEPPGDAADSTHAIAADASATGELPVQVLGTAGIGPTAARNRGLELVLADTDLIGFLDDDSVPAPTWVDHCLRVFREFPTVAAQLGRIGPWRDGSSSGSRLWPGIRQKIYDSRDRQFTADAFRRQLEAALGLTLPAGLPGVATHLSGNNAAVRAEVLREYGLFDERFRTMSDRELALRLLGHGRIIAYNPEMYVEHDHDPSLVRALVRSCRAAPYQQLLESEYRSLTCAAVACQRSVPFLVPLTPLERLYLWLHHGVRWLASRRSSPLHGEPLARAPRR